jgi:hypothetical protein
MIACGCQPDSMEIEEGLDLTVPVYLLPRGSTPVAGGGGRVRQGAAKRAQRRMEPNSTRETAEDMGAVTEEGMGGKGPGSEGPGKRACALSAKRRWGGRIEAGCETPGARGGQSGSR